jgi:hypothetical protein
MEKEKETREQQASQVFHWTWRRKRKPESSSFLTAVPLDMVRKQKPSE